MQEFFSDKTAKVYYDKELDAIFLEYLDKVPNDEQFLLINKELLKAFLSLRTQKFVVDARKMGIIGINSQKWVIDTLLPTMIKHLGGRTLFHAQLLDSAEILSKISATNIQKKAKENPKGFEIVQFTDATKMKAFVKEWK